VSAETVSVCVDRSEAGQVGGLEAIAFGMLVLVLGVLIIGNSWGVIDAKGAASDAAREAARTFATAPAGTDAEADGLARQAALDTVHELGWSRPGITIRRTAVFRLPWIRSKLSAFTARASHSESVDPYRSGVPGVASCTASGP
jgi:hypothetical protein